MKFEVCDTRGTFSRMAMLKENEQRVNKIIYKSGVPGRTMMKKVIVTLCQELYKRLSRKIIDYQQNDLRNCKR